MTGLLCACDVLSEVRNLSRSLGSATAPGPGVIVAVPSVMFNDQGLTLDGRSFADMEKAASESGIRLVMVSCSPTEFFPDIIAAIERFAPAAS